jgi:hypothetical protein
VIEILCRPWTRPVEGRGRRSKYSAGWTAVVAMLRGELKHLAASQCIIEMAVREIDIRNDGFIRSTARPSHPGVRLSFVGRHGPLSYETAAWSSWEHNVYAIARTLRAQRMMSIDGCVRGDQAYRGWKQLPGGGSAPIVAGEWPTVEAAMRWLCSVGNGSLLSVLPADLDAVYRAAARKAHPDAGGSNELMAKVNRARNFVASGGVA